jgi:hypothetical protein
VRQDMLQRHGALARFVSHRIRQQPRFVRKRQD